MRSTMSDKKILTTGDVAKICCVAPRTVSKWFDSGKLRGYRIPGSKDRRIPVAQLVRFLRSNGMPLNGLDSGQTRVLLLDGDVSLARRLAQELDRRGDYETRVATSVIETGAMAAQWKPHAMLVDVALPDVIPKSISRWVCANEELPGTRLIAMAPSASRSQGQTLLQDGFHAFLSKPFEMRSIVKVLESLTANMPT